MSITAAIIGFDTVLRMPSDWIDGNPDVELEDSEPSRKRHETTTAQRCPPES
jgi:hypothetical protein